MVAPELGQESKEVADDSLPAVFETSRYLCKCA